MDNVSTLKTCKDCVFCKEFAKQGGSDFACINFTCYTDDITDYVKGGVLIDVCKLCQAVRRDPKSCGPAGVHFINKPREVVYDS